MDTKAWSTGAFYFIFIIMIICKQSIMSFSPPNTISFYMSISLSLPLSHLSQFIPVSHQVLSFSLESLGPKSKDLWPEKLRTLSSNFAFLVYRGIYSDWPDASPSWQIDGETMETVTDFIFLGFKITADGDCSHEIKRCLLLGRKTMANLDSILKSRDITLLTKVCLIKAMVFPVVMYGCESWTIKKAER